MLYVVAIGGALVFFLVMLFSILSCFKRCRSDQILVVYGKVGTGQSARCIHGGAALVWPVIQGYQFMDLKPISVEADLKGALSKQNIRINAPSSFTIGISTRPEIMQNAAERLLGLNMEQVRRMAEDIIMGQMRQVIASMTIEEINADREKLIMGVTESIATELDKIGLRLINVNIRDVTDQGGYIEALGQEAASKAVNEAKIKVAQAERDGAIGSAEARRAQTIQVAAANAEARKGENTAQIIIADSDAERRTREALAAQRAETSELVAQAETEKNSYDAKREAENARAEVENATRFADIVVPAQIEQQKALVDADAFAESKRRTAAGEADAIRAVKLAEAEGIRATLEGRAEGFKRLTEASGANPSLAINLLLVEQMPVIVERQTEAIKNLKIDQVTVWENGGKDGAGATANFVQSLIGALPPLHALAKQAGLDLPEYLGTARAEVKVPPPPSPSAAQGR
ncbi:MAG: flotillin family protein [Verrucomicrobiales bacterium]|jgi:flotillin|nr:flotillin family protein [Verrucomicrobiales bacterium]